MIIGALLAPLGHTLYAPWGLLDPRPAYSLSVWSYFVKIGRHGYLAPPRSISPPSQSHSVLVDSYSGLDSTLTAPLSMSYNSHHIRLAAPAFMRVPGGPLIASWVTALVSLSVTVCSITGPCSC